MNPDELLKRSPAIVLREYFAADPSRTSAHAVDWIESQFPGVDSVLWNVINWLGGRRPTNSMPDEVFDAEVLSLLRQAGYGLAVWEGSPVYATYKIDPAPAQIVVEFISAVDQPPQGLRIEASGALLTSEGQQAREVLLWYKPGAPEMSVHLARTRETIGPLKIGNVWCAYVGGREAGITLAGQGQSGMLIDRSADGRELMVRCRNVEGPSDFSALVARVTLV